MIFDLSYLVCLIIICDCLINGVILRNHDATEHTAIVDITTVGNVIVKRTAIAGMMTHETEMDEKNHHHRRVLCFDPIHFFPFIDSMLDAGPKSFF